MLTTAQMQLYGFTKSPNFTHASTGAWRSGLWSPLRVPCGRFDPAAFLTRQAGSTCFSSREIHKICLGPAATVELDSGVARERKKLPWCVTSDV